MSAATILPFVGFPALQAIVAGAATVVLIAGVWTIAQSLLAWWYHEDLSDRDTPAPSQ